MLHDQGVILATVLGSAVVIALLPASLLVFLCRAAGSSAMVLAGVAALPLAGAFLLGVELVATGSVLFAATLESAG
jgi:hypothetical protein